MNELIEIVGGKPDEAEVTAVVAASLAVGAAMPAPAPPAQTGEWVLRARCGGSAGSPFAGARSRAWQWSLHP